MSIEPGPTIGDVVMPLVRVMKDADLSWMDRVALSAAIQACARHWQEMNEEREKASDAGSPSTVKRQDQSEEWLADRLCERLRNQGKKL